MSNVLAIAAVTQLLKDLLNDTLINGNVTQVLNSDFVVTALPPDRIVTDEGDQPTRINLFLYGVSPNPALRNADLPTRSSGGDLLQRPRLALDLHYILTVVSGEELHAEILLGYAMQLLHETALLGRRQVREALALAAMDIILPPVEFDPIRASEVADQLELLKITPRTVSLDDMSKLWTAFQASYRTTVAYDVSVVLIERELPTRAALPVLSRGGPVDPATGRDPGVLLRPDAGSPLPELSSAVSADGHPVMRLGGAVVLSGLALDGGEPGTEVSVRFAEPGTGVVLVVALGAAPAPDRIAITLPPAAAVVPGSPEEGTVNDPALWRIGPYFVSVALRHPGGREVVSNALPLALAPAATTAIAATPSGIDVTMTCFPPIRPGQSVAMLAGGQMAVLTAPATPSTSQSASFDGFAVGDHVTVRLRVDGVDSPVIDLTARPPALERIEIT